MWLLEVVANSCVRARSSMRTFLADAGRMSHVREVTFENEWEFLLSTEPTLVLPPPGIRSADLQPLLNDVRLIITGSGVEHLRFVDFLLSPAIFQAVGSHRTLYAMSLEGCFPPDFLFRSTLAERASWAMTGLTYLALGLGRQQHAMWMVVSLCPALRHLYVYAASGDDTVDFPWDGHYTLAVVHRLHTLHIDDAEPCVGGLIEWLATAGGIMRDPGNLTRLRLRVKGSVCLTDTVWLLQTLSAYHPGLEVLILDGVQHAPVALVAMLAGLFPSLQCLRLTRRNGEFSARYGFSIWENPIYEYARALSKLTHLRHFEANFRWKPHSYSPSALDRLARGTSAPDAHGDEPDAAGMCGSLHSDDCMADGVSLVMPFAAYCSALETFAVNADVALFSCSIQRAAGDAYSIHDVCDSAHIYANDRWNPPNGRTWSQPWRPAYRQ